MLIPSTRRLLASAGVLASVGLLAAGCGSSKSSTSSSTTAATGASTTAAGSSTTAAGGTGSVPGGTLNGSGSTFQKNFDDDSIAAFDQAHSGVTINYAGGGSGAGQTALKGHLVDFAGTDSLVKDTTLAAAIDYFPTVVGPITLSYNLPSVSKLTLSAPTIAKIFSGAITTWNAAPIMADNPGVTLPGTAITPVHRSDGSGTTSNFTKFLTKAAPGVWTLGSSSTVAFPGGLGESGNPGVANAVKSTMGAIGYVDYSNAVALSLHFASIKNKAGNVVAPSLAGASAAAAGVTVKSDLTFDPTWASGANAYPITSPTWVIVYKTQADATKKAILKAFLNYLLTTAQTSIASQDNYAAIPAGLDQQALAQLNQL